MFSNIKVEQNCY